MMPRLCKLPHFSMQLVLAALGLFALSGPVQSEQAPQPVGMSGWKIGLSHSLYLTAPANMKSGGVEWNPIPAIAFSPSSWSAQNDDVRVELVRGAAARFDDIRKAAFTRIGGDGTSGTPIKLDGYDGVRFSRDGKTAIVSRQSTQAWAVVILPGSTPKAKSVADEVLFSIWLERVEKPQWKDRVVGYSWQAELPFELAESYSSGKNTEYYRVRWNDFSVDTMKGGAYTDFDKTVENQIAQMKSRADIKDVRVQRFNRAFGYLAKERGHAAQIDFLRGTERNRVYEIASVTGYGALFTSIRLKPDNPQHLAWAHRILSTLRLGYGVPGDQHKPVEFAGEPIAYESETTFRAPQYGEGLKTFVGNDSRSFLFVVDLGENPVPPLSGEMKSLGELASSSMIGNLVRGMGGKIRNAQILPFAAGAFPARRVRVEVEINKRTFFGDAIAILPAQTKLFMPLYLTDSATNDKMPRVASTLNWRFPEPSGWQLQNAGTSDFKILMPNAAKPVHEKDKWSVEFNHDHVQVRVEEKREPFRDEIYMSLEGLTEGERADNPMENDYAALFELKKRMAQNYGFNWARTGIGEAQGVVGWGAAKEVSKMQDTVVLRNGTHTWVCEIIWNSHDKTSRARRDAILGSIRCDSTPIVTTAHTAPSTPATPSTPAHADSQADDWGWGWWW